MVTILMKSAKMATLSLLKTKVFWNKGCHVIISVHDLTNKILTRDSNYLDMIMWPKFGNSSISVIEVIITSVFEGKSWFKFNNLVLALGIALKFYTPVGKSVKTKSQKVFGSSSYVCRSYRGKAGSGGTVCPPLPS